MRVKQTLQGEAAKIENRINSFEAKDRPFLFSEVQKQIDGLNRELQGLKQKRGESGFNLHINGSEIPAEEAEVDALLLAQTEKIQELSRRVESAEKEQRNLREKKLAEWKEGGLPDAVILAYSEEGEGERLSLKDEITRVLDTQIRHDRIAQAEASNLAVVQKMRESGAGLPGEKLIDLFRQLKIVPLPFFGGEFPHVYLPESAQEATLGAIGPGGDTRLKDPSVLEQLVSFYEKAKKLPNSEGLPSLPRLDLTDVDGKSYTKTYPSPALNDQRGVHSQRKFEEVQMLEQQKKLIAGFKK